MSVRLLELLGGARPATSGDGRVLGAAIGVVTDNKDPTGMGRVRVRLLSLDASHESFWAPIVAPMAADGCGVFFLPNKDDAVVVIFERGEVRFPLVIGALWTGQDKPPADNADGENNICVIKSRGGHVIRLNDKKDAATIEISDPSGNSVVIDTRQNTITLTAKNIVLDAEQGTIQLKAKSIQADATSAAHFKASQGAVDVVANGNLKLQGQRVDINP